MFNLDDILRQAQQGGAMDNLARQFGLSPQQTQSAVEAMMPAFQMGLQRQTQNAQSMGDLFSRIASGRYGQAFEDPTAARAAVADGNDALAQLFGAKDVSRAVAAQASAMSGVSSTIIKAMLPVVASMLLGGMFKNVNNQGLGGVFGQLAEAFTGASRSGSGGGFGDILGQMMGGGRAAPQAQMQAGGGFGPLGDLLGQMMGGGRAPTPAPGGAGGGFGPLGDLLGQMMGGAAAGRAPTPAPGGAGGGLGDILGQMMGGGMAQPQAPQGDLPRSRGRVEDEISDMLGGGGRAGVDPRRAPSRAEAEEEMEAEAQQQAQPSLQDIFGQMFQTGREVQQGQQDALRDIFEQMTGQRRR